MKTFSHRFFSRLPKGRCQKGRLFYWRNRSGRKPSPRASCAMPMTMNALRIHFMDDRFQSCHFCACDDAIQNRTFCTRIGAGPFQDGDTAFQFLEHTFRDRLGFAW